MWAFTSSNDPKLYSSHCSSHVWWVPHVTEEGTIVTELCRTQLYWDVPLVDVTNKLNSILKLNLSGESFPTGKVENLQREANLE